MGTKYVRVLALWHRNTARSGNYRLVQTHREYIHVGSSKGSLLLTVCTNP